MNQRLLAAVLLGSAATFAFAQQHMKPGLWEVSNKMQTGSGQMEQQMAQMQQQMASMSPEQRKMVEDMMAQRGVRVGGGGAGSLSVKVCVTKEMVERGEMPTQRGDCKSTRQMAGGGTMKMTFTCANPPSSGEGEVSFASPESYTMKMVVNTTVQGRPEKVNMQGSGRWLGADCGDIKPAGSK